MPVLNVDQFLVPVSATDPAGPNLEYDPGFIALERAAQGKPEQQMGGVIVPAEPPDWNIVFDLGSTLLGKTRDLRVAAYLTEASLHRYGLEGFAEGLRLVRGLVENHWSTVHPQLDPDDGNDPTMRSTALAALATPNILNRLRLTPLLRSRSLGTANLKDLTTTGRDGTQPNPGGPDGKTIEAIFLDTEVGTLEALVRSVQGAAQDLASLETSFETHSGMRGPDFSALTQLLRQARQALEPRLQQRKGDGAAPADASAGGESPGPAAAEPNVTALPRPRTMTGDITSREDVVRAIDKILSYYEKHEPSSPLPLLLQRCKRLVSMSFLEVVKDLAPDAMKQVELVAGKPEGPPAAIPAKK